MAASWPLVRVPATPAHIAHAAWAIARGELVAFPTETVYGLGANAFDPVAVARIFEVKRRPHFDPLIVHVAEMEMLRRVVDEIPPHARTLIEAFWPGPLTLILRKSERVPLLVTSGLSSVAVRMPAHPVAQALLRAADCPIAAPSANPFGGISPTRAAHVQAGLGDGIALLLDGGATLHGLESTILALEPEPTILRHGALPASEIERVLQAPVAVRTHARATVHAPGQLAHHYAPHAPLRVVEAQTVPLHERAGAALLAFRNDQPGYTRVRVLSGSGDLREAAAQLFAALHTLDAAHPTRIDAELLPEEGLGIAINDRLRRAAAGSAVRKWHEPCGSSS